MDDERYDTSTTDDVFCGRRESLYVTDLFAGKILWFEPMNSKAVVQNIERALFTPRFITLFVSRFQRFSKIPTLDSRRKRRHEVLVRMF